MSKDKNEVERKWRERKKCTLKQIPNRQKTPYYHVSAEVSIKMHLRDTLCLTDFLLIDITVIVKQKASKPSSFKLKTVYIVVLYMVKHFNASYSLFHIKKVLSLVKVKSWFFSKLLIG